MKYNQWDEVTLSEVTDKIGDGLHGTPKYDDLGECFFVNGNNLNGKITIDNHTKRVSHSEYLKHKKDLNNTTILLSINGTLGKLAFYNGERVILGKSACYINVKNEVNKKFIYYTLKSTQFLSYLRSHSSGTTIKNLGLREIRNFSFSLPNYITQKAIANILSSLDDKIELNNKINKNLEEIAQTLYKRWFVDFEFPNENGEPYKSSGGEMVDSELGMIPKGWEVRDVNKLFEFKGGAQPPKEEHIYEHQKGYIRFIQNRDYRDGSNHLTYIKESSKNKLANKYDIMMDKYGEVGKIRYGLEGAYNVALAKIDPYDTLDREFLRGYFSQDNILQYLSNSSIASTRGSLNATTFTGLKVAYPNKHLKLIFKEIQKNTIDMILEKKSENVKLAKIRDELLPKLMSGEIEVPVEE